MTEPKLIYDVEPDLYRCASSAEYEVEFSPDVWTYQCRITEAKDAITSEIERVQSFAPNHEIFLAVGDRTNYRYSVYPFYKSNRLKYRKPAGYSALRKWLNKTWPILTLPNVEADDVVGICYEEDDVIYSRDKDLRTIPGIHIDSIGSLEEISEWEADLSFYTQVLTGDACDGYPGCPGVGPKTAAKIIAGATDQHDLWELVKATYIKTAKKKPEETPSVLTMARCARILRNGEYDHENGKPILWEPPYPREVFIPNFHD